MDKPEIKYPCRWPYKVIGADRDQMEREINAKLENYDYTAKPGNTSSGGKFISFNVKVLVQDEKQRVEVFHILSNITSVKMVF